MTGLCIGQPGFEALLRQEVGPCAASPASGPGWMFADFPSASPTPDPAFPHRILWEAKEIKGDSVNRLATQIVDWFVASLQGERIEGPWPNLWSAPAEPTGLGRRLSAVEDAFNVLLKKKLSRVARLGTTKAFATEVGGGSAWPPLSPTESRGSPSAPRGARDIDPPGPEDGNQAHPSTALGTGRGDALHPANDRPLPSSPLGAARGLFVWFVDFQIAYVARAAWLNGQRRMSDDPNAPSRSYLKIEEAYGVLGREPAQGETVVDLGAAPGGWSYSAAKRGARVVAVDNGPLKGGALGNPLIEHVREDAFRFSPRAGAGATSGACDWLFCDLVEEPHHVLEHIVRPWLERGWCRRFVVNLKFGRVDPLRLLAELRAPLSPFVRAASAPFRIRHLYHDREEFTVTGEANPDSSAHPRSSD